jgi:hypothetical protein
MKRTALKLGGDRQAGTPLKCKSPLATTIMDTVYANGAVQPRLFSEAEL